MADVTTSADRRGFLIPDDRLNYSNGFSAADSTYTEQGQIPGSPDPQSESEMVLDTAGSSDGSDYVVQLNRAGFAEPDGAAYVYRIVDDDTSPKWAGWNGPQSISGFEFIDRSTTADYWKHFHAVTLSDGKIVAVASNQGRYVKSVVMSESAGTWGTAVEVYDLGSAYSVADGPYPTVVALPGGRLLCFFWHELSATEYQIGMAYSDDTAASWTVASLSCLDDNLDTTSTTPYRLRAVYHNGRIGIFGVVEDSGPVLNLYQWVSHDLGTSFSQVAKRDGANDEMAIDAVAIPNGGVVVAWLLNRGSGTPNVPVSVRVLGNLTESIDDDAIDPTLVSTMGSAEWGDTATPTDSDLALWRDDDGTIYLCGRDTSGTETINVIRSLTGGVSWGWVGTSSSGGTGGSVYHANDASTALHDFCVVSQGARQVMICRLLSNPGTHDDSMCAVYLGGMTTLPLPYRKSVVENMRNQTGYELVWLPIDTPPNTGSAWTASTAGSPTSSMTSSGYRVQHSGASDALSWSAAVTDGLSTGVHFMVQAEVPVGIWHAEAEISDGVSVSYKVRVILAPTAITVVDAESGGTISTTSTTAAASGVQVMIAVGNSAGSPGNDGKTRVWYAEVDPSSTRRRFKIAASSDALQAGTTASSSVSIGSIAGYASADGYLQFIGITDGSYTGKALFSGQNSPDRVLGRTLSIYPAWMHGGTKLFAVDGPGYAGESWNITHTARYPLSAVFYDQDPSQGGQWRSTDDTVEVQIGVRYDATEESYPMGATLALLVLGANVETLELWGESSSSWSKISDIDMKIGTGSLGFVREHDRIRPNQSSGSAIGRGIYYNSLAGSTISIGAGGSRSLHKIVRNGSGLWAPSTATKPVQIQVDGITGSEVTSGTNGEIYSKDALVILPAGYGTLYSAFQVRIPVQSTADGYFTLSNLVLGHIEYLSNTYGWGRSVSLAPRYTVHQSRSGRKRVTRDGNPRRAVEVAWPNWIDTRRFHEDAGSGYPEPDYWRAHTGGSGPIVAAMGDTPYTVTGLIEDLGGAEVPIGYCAAIPINASAALHVITDRSLFLWGRIVSEVAQLDVPLGDAGKDEVMRVNTVRVEEEP